MIMQNSGKPADRRHALRYGRLSGRTRLEMILIITAGVLLCCGITFFVLYINSKGQTASLTAESGAETSEANVVGTSDPSDNVLGASRATESEMTIPTDTADLSGVADPAKTAAVNAMTAETTKKSGGSTSAGTTAATEPEPTIVPRATASAWTMPSFSTDPGSYSIPSDYTMPSDYTVPTDITVPSGVTVPSDVTVPSGMSFPSGISVPSV